MFSCKITVLRKSLFHDLAAEYLNKDYQAISYCDFFEEGQEFVIDPASVPNDFSNACPWAWADIRKDILAIAYGGDIPGYRHKGITLSSCTDWFRPVLFKIERIGNHR